MFNSYGNWLRKEYTFASDKPSDLATTYVTL